MFIKIVFYLSIYLSIYLYIYIYTYAYNTNIFLKPAP